MMSDTTPTPPLSHPFRVSALSNRKPSRFDLAPDAQTRRRIAEYLGISAVNALRFRGTLTPVGRHDFVLEADLVAKVVQPCSVTLAPVPADLRDHVMRRYLAELPVPEGDEVEMPEDDSAEPLPEVIDAGFVALEALALVLPLYPRAKGAELPEVAVAPPGVAPLQDKDLKPFASLAGLKAALEGKKDATE